MSGYLHTFTCDECGWEGDTGTEAHNRFGYPVCPDCGAPIEYELDERTNILSGRAHWQ